MKETRRLQCDSVVDETVTTPVSLPSWEETKTIDHILLPRPGWVIAPTVFLHLHLQIRKRHLFTGETRPLELGDQCAILNFPHSTIWRTAEIFFGPYLITATNATHTYFCYLQALLSMPADVKRTYLARAAFWYPDTPTNYDIFDVQLNEGYKQRSLPFVGDRIVELYAPMMFEIFRQPNPFPDDLTVTIRLTRNSHRFCINGVPDKDWTYELGIHKADLCITRYRPVQRYRVGDLHFPIRNYSSRFTVIPQGNASASIDILDQVAGAPKPDYVGVGQISQEAFNGSFGHNGLNFQLNDLKQAHLLINNSIILPPLGYQFDTMNYGDGSPAFAVKYLKSYVESLRAAPISVSLLGGELPISYEEFAGGLGILWWDLRDDRHTAGNATRRDKAALNLRYVAEHWQPLAAPIVLFCIFVSDRELILKQNGIIDWKL